MSPREFFDKWAEFVAECATRYHRAVRRYGWEDDDCRQHAMLVLWKLAAKPHLWAMTDEDLQRFLHVAVRNSIFNESRRQSAKKRPLLLQSARADANAAVDNAEAREQDWATTFVSDTLGDAPEKIRKWMEWSFFAGPHPGWAERTMSRVRRSAAVWLLVQLEGRVKR